MNDKQIVSKHLGHLHLSDTPVTSERDQAGHKGLRPQRGSRCSIIRRGEKSRWGLPQVSHPWVNMIRHSENRGLLRRAGKFSPGEQVFHVIKTVKLLIHFYLPITSCARGATCT